LNRINTFILIFFSVILSSLVVFFYLKESREQEHRIIISPFKIEVYRVDRHPLPEADIYLNQRFIGKTDKKGFFSKNIKLVIGESYTLRVERDRDGYVYGPWETSFKVEEEKERRKEKKKDEESGISTLEGESDILTELERAQLGKASLYEKYHFLAFVDGYMFYSIRVHGKNNTAIENAAVFINGKEEGKTDKNGVYLAKYSGEDIRKAKIQIFKEGEHIWMNEVLVKPNSYIEVGLNQMLLIDLFIYAEYYNVIKGVENAEVYLGPDYMGKTDKDGIISFRYINENSVDGYLDLIIHYPESFLPDRLKKTIFIEKDLPKLSVIDFGYSKDAVPPKVAVMPFIIKNREDHFLKRQAMDLKTGIEDYISSKGVFTIVSSKMISEMFHQFNINYTRENFSWKDIPLIKKELDAIIFGKISGSGNDLKVELYGFDYTGENIFEIDRTVSLRELQSLSEDIAGRFKNNFPVEGNIVSISKKIYVNLGYRHGVRQNNMFYGFIDYFDTITKTYSKKRVVKLKIVDTGETFSAGDLEDISEGYLLEPGVKVKRFVESMEEKSNIPLTIVVFSKKNPVSDANVYRDDHWFGQTDHEGKLKVMVRPNIDVVFLVYKEGYIPDKKSVKVTGDIGVLNFDLKQGQTLFRVSSTPDNALLYIDGEYKGTTPISEKPLVVSYGFHLLELELEGYTMYRDYINFNKKKLSLTGKNSIVLFLDYLKDAEEEYTSGNIHETITILRNVPYSHPDYTEALELLGYIYLNDIKDFKKSIEYYNRSLESSKITFKAAENLFSYYNLAQAYYNEAENEFYMNKSLAQYNYVQAILNFDYIRGRRNKIPVQKRITVYQDILFYLSVCYQKLYYLSLKNEYLSRAYFSWIDYFDFYDDDLLNDTYFKHQYFIAKSYKEEAERLKSGE